MLDSTIYTKQKQYPLHQLKQLLLLLVIVAFSIGQSFASSRTQSSQLYSSEDYAAELRQLARQDPEAAVRETENALRHFSLHPDPEAHGRIINELSYALYFLGDLGASMKEAKNAEKMALENRLGNVLARSRMLQGNVLQNIGEYTRAVNQYVMAAKYYQETNNQLFVGYCYNNMANTYVLAGMYKSALDYYYKSKETFRNGSVEIGIGNTLLRMGNANESIAYFNSGIQLYLEDNDLLGVGYAKNSLADAYLELNQPEKALALYNESYQHASKTSQAYTIVNSMLGKAKSYLALNNFDEALKWAKAVRVKAEDIEEEKSFINIFEVQAQIYKESGDIEKAYFILNEARELEKTIKKEQGINELAVMQAVFESDERIAEIKSLEEKNKVLNLQKEIESNQAQNAKLLLAAVIGILFFLTFYAIQFYREKRRLSNMTSALEKAREQAEQAAQTKSAFLANMSHEIRTPLTSIIGYADGILEGDIDTIEQERVINIISENGNHLLEVINDILDFTKIEANKLEFEILETELFPIISQIESITGKRARDKELHFEVRYLYPLPSNIMTDPTRLKQILFNLTNNAIKFTEKGGISLTVESNSKTICISVRDTGIGINTENQQHLFQPFSQADGSINRRFGGSGLGLSISQHLAHGLGGEIKVDSEEGKGSRFTVVIPLVESANSRWVNSTKEIAEHTHHNTRQIQKLPNFNQSKVLLAEDHPNNRELISMMLKRMNISVTAVENGLQACDEVLNNEFDLILMDIQMPVMDGLSAFKKIRSFDNSTKIIALTANNMKHEVKRYLEEGFNGHLPKPLPKDALIEQLTKYLSEAENIPPIAGHDNEMAVLANDYFQCLKDDIKCCQQAWESRDIETLKEHAHKIKGSAGSFGFAELTEYFATIENACKTGSIDELPQIMQNTMPKAHFLTHIPGINYGVGLENHHMNVSTYIESMKAFIESHSANVDAIGDYIQSDKNMALLALQRELRYFDALAITNAVFYCQTLIEQVSTGAPIELQKTQFSKIKSEFDQLQRYFS